MLRLKNKILAATGLTCLLAIGLSFAVLQWSQQESNVISAISDWLGIEVLWLLMIGIVILAMFVVSCFIRDLSNSLRALEIGLLNFKDNDFSVTVPSVKEPEINQLISLFNESAQTLRREKQYIYQRELLLDKVIQSSPNIMLLLDSEQRIIYSNDAARHFFFNGKQISGMNLVELLPNIDEELSQAIKSSQEGIFTLNSDDVESWHISRGAFLLNNLQHNLLLLKHMTKELNRQEVAVWKKVIRIISHELNNSLAPISSMVNSGRKLTKDNSSSQLKLIFDTIENRCNHLSQFIFNYARFAKLPLPQKSYVDWQSLTEQLAQHYSFKLIGSLPQTLGYFDHIQIEQVLLNLLKNAHESGSDINEVTMQIAATETFGKNGVSICVHDTGSGMSSEVMQQALLPFYSTKQSGTGLGLPLCREIIEAHEGQISLHHRQHKGLTVQVWLPCNNSN
ncbi:ATP-binding protein [Parashewanella spongiae]|nr:ATP-binding protein [Parashewanella spongiae]MCL1078127.1 ATP-binding protein [Parashewanella spongiae]